MGNASSDLTTCIFPTAADPPRKSLDVRDSSRSVTQESNDVMAAISALRKEHSRLSRGIQSHAAREDDDVDGVDYDEAASPSRDDDVVVAFTDAIVVLDPPTRDGIVGGGGNSIEDNGSSMTLEEMALPEGGALLNGGIRSMVSWITGSSFCSEALLF